MSAVWRAWWDAESHWNLGTGRGWSGSQSPHRGRTSAFQTHTKGLSSLSIPSQEEAQSRRRELAKKLLTWVDFVVATAYPRRHIPEGKLPASHPLLS